MPTGWPTYEQAVAAQRSTPLLVILTDFSDSDIASYLPDPDRAWAALMFGRNQGQANNYWYDVSRGQFQLIPARDSYGVVNDGVVRVHVSAKKPTTGQYVIQDQPWIAEALDLASQYVRFSDYDKNGDGHIGNLELSVLVPLNLDYANMAGAGAEANIEINHAIPNSGVTVDKFLRVEDNYTSIGTPSHELGHHIFDLEHFAGPTTHDLMGLGAYAEDPVITTLHTTTSHYATRPAGLMARHQVQMGLVTPTRITDTTLGVKLYSSHHLQYNVIELPVLDGYVYLENRTAEGYDRSIPFCDGSTGALFPTEVSQYVQPLDIPGITRNAQATVFDEPDGSLLCDAYALAGHNASFSYGQFTISNVSAAGQVMTFDVTKRNMTPSIDHFKLRYWVVNPNKEGYRMFHSVRVQANTTTNVDFASFPSGTDPSAWFTISLEAYYTTGEVRSVNADATWTTTSKYLFPDVLPINQTMPKSDAIVHLLLIPSATKEKSADLDVGYAGFTTRIHFVNLP